MSKVTVWKAGKFARGWDGKEDLDHVDIWPTIRLLTALERRYKSDAHFVPYRIQTAEGTTLGRIPRLRKSALAAVRAEGASVLFDVVVLDVDCPSDRKVGGVAPDSWRVALREKVAALPWASTVGYYETQGGARLLWELREPLWPEAYVWVLGRLRRELRRRGVDCDRLVDWTRCYRLPWVRREGVVQDWPAAWDGLGVLEWGWEEGSLPAVGSWAVEDREGREGREGRDGISGWFAGIERAGIGERFELPAEIGEGTRNTILLRYAGQLRNLGLSGREILGILERADWERCKPPLQEEESGGRELERIARTADGWDPRGAPGRNGRLDLVLQSGTGLEIAEKVLEELEEEQGGGEKLVYDRGRLWAWSGRSWEPLAEEVVQRQIWTVDRTWYPTAPRKDGTPGWTQVRMDIGGVRRAWDAVCLARSRPGWFASAGVGVAFLSTVVRWVDGEVLIGAASPRDRVMGSVPFAWEAGCTPGLLLETLGQIWDGDEDIEDKIRLYREFVGVCMLGAATLLQQGVILLGGGSNGKGVLQAVVRALFVGDTLTAIAPQDIAHEYRRARLAGSRLNLVDELPDAEILSSAALKSAIAGDLMEGRHIHHKPFEFRPVAGWLMSGNALPSVRDLSWGFWRRLLVLTCNRQFAAEEADRGLADRIIAAELAEIACWAVEGGLDALRRGHYIVPASAETELKTWKESADQISAWFSERVKSVENGAGWVRALSVYHDYQGWAQVNGHQVMSSTAFGRRARTLNLRKKRTEKGNVYKLVLEK